MSSSSRATRPGIDFKSIASVDRARARNAIASIASNARALERALAFCARAIEARAKKNAYRERSRAWAIARVAPRRARRRVRARRAIRRTTRDVARRRPPRRARVDAARVDEFELDVERGTPFRPCRWSSLQRDERSTSIVT